MKWPVNFALALLAWAVVAGIAYVIYLAVTR